MKATAILMTEHRVIEQVLSVLEVMARRAEQLEVLDAAAAGEALDFLRTFADGCHHGKEEDELFPRLEARGLARDGGPTGVMRHEHDLGRTLIGRMATAVERRSPAEFAGPAREYVRLLRDHIWKEDNRLFQMADRVLTAGDDDELLRGFEAAEHRHLGTGTHEAYLALADRLADRFAVPRANAQMTCGCSGPPVPAGGRGATDPRPGDPAPGGARLARSHRLPSATRKP
ncbi:MAG TPA: hemerythrin domain-containing protein [Gemmataceae bacterium]|nr:hemerythrin domain-containing protein [Gemmataceae bacterium]